MRLEVQASEASRFCIYADVHWERDFTKTIKSHVIHFYILFLESFGEVCHVCV